MSYSVAMNSIFVSSFTSLFYAIAQVFVVMGIAGFLMRRKLISSELITALSQIVVLVLLPCLSFDKITNGFHPEATPGWWMIPLIGVGLIVIGLFASILLFGWRVERRYLWALSSLQNCTFFVLPIGKIVYPDQFDQFALYVFLMALFVNPILWSLGKVLITNTGDWHWKKFITPPFVANVLAFLFVFTEARQFIPQIVMGPIEMLGSAAVPLATFILGATLGAASVKGLPPIADLFKYISIKFFLLPIVTLLGIYMTQLRATSPMMADFLLIEASAASATALIIQIRRYGGLEAQVSSMMLIGYALCLVLLPLWLALSASLAHFSL